MCHQLRALYNINLDDLSPYDLIVEADDKNEDEVFQIVNNYSPSKESSKVEVS